MKTLISPFITALALLVGAPAYAQPAGQSDGWGLDIGAGALLSPAYRGDDNYRASLLPYVKIEYGDRFFASVQDGVGYTLVKNDRLRFGPIARIAFARNEDGDQAFAIAGDETPDLAGLGDVNTTVELGGFAEIDIGVLTATLEARHGINGHEGFIADARLSYSGRTSAGDRPLFYSVGPRATFVGDSYNDAYFGVTAEQALASGLPVFDASSGIQSVGVGAAVILPITRDGSVSMVAIAGYDRLTGDAGDAPLVRRRGSRDQATLGLFMSYAIW
ncbi:MAG: MipA/OmpV family protein [Pseudomonadota bacterium]